MWKQIIIFLLIFTIISMFLCKPYNKKESFYSQDTQNINRYNQQNAYDTTVPVPKYETPTRDSGVIFINTPESAALIQSIKNAPATPELNFKGFNKIFDFVKKNNKEAMQYSEYSPDLNADTSQSAIDKAYGSYSKPIQPSTPSVSPAPTTITPSPTQGPSQSGSGGGSSGPTQGPSQSSGGGGSSGPAQVTSQTGGGGGSSGAAQVTSQTGGGGGSSGAAQGPSQTGSSGSNTQSSSPPPPPPPPTSKGGVMNIKIINNAGLSDPNPNGIYSITVNDALFNKDLTFNNTIDVPYGPGSTLKLEIYPKKSSVKIKHYDDIFPMNCRIDIVFDINNIFSLPTTGSDMIVTDDGIITFTSFGLINDKNRKNIGNIKNDVIDNQHFIIDTTSNENIKKIVIMFIIPSSS